MSTTSPDRPLGQGWARTDGPAGVRNHVVALSTVALVDQATRYAAAQVPGTLSLTPQFERGLRGEDAALQARTIRALVSHPNIGAALVVTHDRAAAEELRHSFEQASKPVTVKALMACHGMADAASRMVEDLRQLHRRIADTPRVPVTLRDLTVALECGGSDASSAICANPAIGRFVDRLTDAGGTAIVSETAEFLGGENVIRSQSASPEIAGRILACLEREEKLMLETGEDYRGVNPTRENIEAGLTTLIEKTMGAVCKIGKSRFAGCLGFGETPGARGLYFMDTPFFSPTSLSGMALGGAQIALFAMGVFNPSGLPFMPVIKICGNPETLVRWRDGIDLGVAGLIVGEETLDRAARRIEDRVSRIVSGEKTCTERWNEGQLILPRSSAAL